MSRFKRIIEHEEGVAPPYYWKILEEGSEVVLSEGRTITEDLAEDICDLQEEILSFYMEAQK